MGIYWRRSTKILPGIRINWSKSGPSISMGPKGAKVNVGKRGTYVSGGIPGTGLYYRQKVKGKTKTNASSTGGIIPPAHSTQSSHFFSKQVCIVAIVAVVILLLLLSKNFLTAILIFIVTVLCWFVLSLKRASSSLTNTNMSQATSPISVPNTTSPASTHNMAMADNEIDIKIAVAEIEGLVREIDNTTDKVLLPSIYRKLMSIIYKLEKNDNGVSIQDTPIVDFKEQVLLKYRKKMNS